MLHIQTNSVIQRTKITAATTSPATIVAALAGNKAILLSITITAASAVTITFNSDTTALTGAMTLAAGVPLTISAENYGILQTATGEGLKFTLGGTVQVSGTATWIYETA